MAAMAAMCVLFIISSFIFCIKYPHVCSVDFRYSVFLVIPFSVITARYIMKMRKEAVKLFLLSCTAVFSFSGCVMYLCVK